MVKVRIEFQPRAGFGDLWAARITQWGWEHPKLAFGEVTKFGGGAGVVELRVNVGEVIRYGRKCFASQSKSFSHYAVVQDDGTVSLIDRVIAKSRWTELQHVKAAKALMTANAAVLPASRISPAGAAYLAGLKKFAAEQVFVADLPSDEAPQAVAQAAPMVVKPLPQPEAPKSLPQPDLAGPKTYQPPKRKPPTVL